MNQSPARQRSIRIRIVVLAAAFIVSIFHFYLDILFREGPIRPGALTINGVLLGLCVIAAAWLLTVWSRRWARILAAVYLVGIAAATSFVVYTASHMQR